MISRPVWSPWPSAQKDGKSNWLKGERIAVLIGARRSGLNCLPMLLYNSIILARKLAKIEMQMHKSHIRRVHGVFNQHASCLGIGSNKNKQLLFELETYTPEKRCLKKQSYTPENGALKSNLHPRKRALKRPI